MKAIGAAFAAMVGQAAAGRLLFSMARDGRLPKLLANVGEKSGVPRMAILCAAGVNLTLAIIAANQADGLSHLVSFVDIGALTAFVALHISVIGYFIVKQRRRGLIAWSKYLLVPVLGIIALLPVLLHIRHSAQIVGGIWLLVGMILLIIYQFTTRHKTVSNMN